MRTPKPEAKFFSRKDSQNCRQRNFAVLRKLHLTFAERFENFTLVESQAEQVAGGLDQVFFDFSKGFQVRFFHEV